MQITGNHQMARIVRHNDESVREGYIRNGGKEVKLFTSALKAFQCNNRIVMAQRKHLDDFLRGRIIGRLDCGRTQLEVSEELGIAQSVISRLWQRFQDDGNVSRCYSTGRLRVTTPNEDRYLAVTAKRNRRSTASDLPRQLSSATGTLILDRPGICHPGKFAVATTAPHPAERHRRTRCYPHLVIYIPSERDNHQPDPNQSPSGHVLVQGSQAAERPPPKI
ncbi:hypothetical protein AVEN_102396-1 [Araneus ventricosus]|uniref:Transposase Tc1-like domain-containing protein n=1 Tax=Araneus ventricosus TaxID=182803 RepID=A0A4Y2JBT6_ARAVE|nr:hypothetical protein AVEN_102396-1 [Araneus ventricosus]